MELDLQELGVDVRIVDPKYLQSWWELVKPGLAEIRRRTEPTWISEDVYVSLRQGDSTLWIGFEGDTFVGFAIVLTRNNSFNGDKSLIIWTLFMALTNRLDNFIESVKKQALEQGYDQVVFQSPRRAWERRLASKGFVVGDLNFECRLRVKH